MKILIKLTMGDGIYLSSYKFRFGLTVCFVGCNNVVRTFFWFMETENYNSFKSCYEDRFRPAKHEWYENF